MKRLLYIIPLCLYFLNSYTQTDPGTGSLAYSWTFENGSATDIVTGAVGLPIAGATITDGALNTGGTAYMELPASQIQVNTYSEISIETWYTPTAGTNTKYTMLYYFGDTITNWGNNGFFFTSARSDDKSRAAISTANTNQPWTTETGVDYTELDDNIMHHVVTIISNTSIKLYIDGVYIGESIYASTFPANQLAAISNTFAYLARSGYADDDIWRGKIHEFNVYNRELTASEVTFQELKGPATQTNTNNIIVLPGDTITIDNSTNCDSLLLNTNSALIVPIGSTFSVNNNIYIKSNNQSYGELFIEGELVITGNVQIEHTFTGTGEWQFLTIPDTITDFSLLGTTFNDDYAVYEYSEGERATNGATSNVWVKPSILYPGKGYIFAFSTNKTILFDLSAQDFNNYQTHSIPLSFTNSPLTINQEGWNLIGNPFQSTISWEKVINYIDNTLFNSGANSTAIYIYDSATQNYKTYVNGISTNGLTGDLKPLDALFIKTASSGQNISINRKLIPTAITTRSSSIDNEKILRISLQNNLSTDETIIRFNPEATDSIDIKYDAYKFNGGNSICQIYTQYDNTKLAINALSSSKMNREVELLIKCPQAGDYQINFNHNSNFENDEIYLIDKLDGTYQDIKLTSSYKFNSSSTGTINRFTLVFRSLSTKTVTNQATNTCYYNNGNIHLINHIKTGNFKLYTINGICRHSCLLTKGENNIAIELTPGMYVATINREKQIIIVE